MKSFFTIALSLVTMISFAQRSPKAEANGTVNGAHITIKYNSPFVKGRQIYGTDLVPFDKVWRAGADTATRFYTDKDITVEGQKLPAGAYSIYVIASASNDYQVIFNKKTGQWGVNRDGSTTRDAANDALVVKVKARKRDTIAESLVYTINPKGFVLSWEYLDIPVMIK